MTDESLLFHPRVKLPLDERGLRASCKVMPGFDGPSWDGIMITEWEMEREGWEDFHPHDETTYMLAGEMIVECDGVSLTLGAGDAATVRAGHLGRYIVKDYARMLAIYGPNPDGAKSSGFRSFTIDEYLAESTTTE